MDFFTIEGIILVIWVISLVRFILRWMNGRKGSEVPPEEIPEDEEYSIPESPPQKTCPVEEDSDKEYNYKELRERVLRAWGMTGKKPPEMDLPDEMEKSVYRETVNSGEVTSDGAGKGVNGFQAYLSENKRQEHSKKKTKPMEVETVSGPKVTVIRESTGWSEDSVRAWMKYDVVFGEPRSRKSWSPSVRS